MDELPRGKTISIDENSHRILLKAKEEMRQDGIGNPTLSDAIRWIKQNDSEREASTNARNE